jgi:hypothetical protein
MLIAVQQGDNGIRLGRPKGILKADVQIVVAKAVRNRGIRRAVLFHTVPPLGFVNGGILAQGRMRVNKIENTFQNQYISM